MKKSKKSKTTISISLDPKLTKVIKENFNNRSKYIEWLIYKDLKLKGENIENIII